MIGARIFPRIFPRIFARVGLSQASGGGGGPIAGVTRDTASGWYFPANVTEWANLLAAAPLATGNPSSAYLMQEASGNLADSIGTVTLTKTGAGHLYQQIVVGFTRLAATTIDGTAGQKWINTTTAPNPNTVSTLWLQCIRYPLIAPAANRDLIANSASMDCRFTSGGKTQIINGATTAGTGNPLATVQWLAIQHDLTNSLWLAYTLQEKITGTFAAVASNPSYMVGGQTAAAADAGYMYAALFSGTAAELSTAQMRTLFQTLTRDALIPVVIPW